MSAELSARRTAAAAVLADYQRGAATTDVAERAMWGARLADMLSYLLAELDRPRPRIDGSQAATHVCSDGSAVLSPGDLLTALAALGDAARWNAQHGDPGLSVRCDGLRWRLGDDR